MIPLRVSDFSSHRLGETKDPAAVATSGDNRNAVVNLLRQSRRTVDVFSRHLDPAVLDDAEVIEAVRTLVVRSAVASGIPS